METESPALVGDFAVYKSDYCQNCLDMLLIYRT